MPIFEYRCRTCGDEFELFIRSREADAACPICGSKEATKKFSTFGFNSPGQKANSSGSSSCGGCSSNNCNGCHH